MPYRAADREIEMNKTFKRAVGILLAVNMVSFNAFALSRGDKQASALKKYVDYLHAVEEMTKNDDFSDYNGNIQMGIGEKKITSDNGTVRLDVASYEENGRTMVPMRGVGEALNVDVDWDEDTNTAIYTDSKENRRVYVRENEDSITVEQDGRKSKVQIDAAAETKNNRMFVPLRAIAEALNISVGYNVENNSVSMDDTYYTKRILVRCIGTDKNAVGGYVNSLEGKMQMVESGDDELLVQFISKETAKNAVKAIGREYGGSVEAIPDAVVTAVIPNNVGGTKSALDAAGEANITDTRLAAYRNQLISQNKNEEVTIAVVDSGINANHALLAGKVEAGNGDSGNLKDNCGHGTHVAGIIAQAMGGLDYKIVSYKVTDDDGKIKITDDDGIIASSRLRARLRNVGNSGADVINMSLQVHTDNSDVKRLIQGTIEDMAQKSVLVISAGNISNSETGMFSNSVFTETRSNNVIVVGNSQGDSYSESAIYGSQVDISAPGVAIYSADANNSNGYKSMTGTSQSAPHVTAAAAMLMIDGVSESSVKSTLKSSCARVPANWNTNVYGCGILDMSKRLNGTQEFITCAGGILEIGKTATLAVRDKSGNTLSNSQCVFTADSDSVTVDAQGVVTAKKAGNAKITVKYNELTAVSEWTVSEAGAPKANISGYRWSENDITLAVGETKKVTLYETYADGTEKDVTNQASFNVSDDSKAAIDKNGNITARAKGNVIITPSMSSVSAVIKAPKHLSVTITENVQENQPGNQKSVTGYAWSSNSVTVAAGESMSVKLYEKYSDGSQKDITNEASYNVADTRIAEMLQNGTIRGIKGGKTLISASFSRVSSTVKAPRALSVTVTENRQESQQGNQKSVTGYAWSNNSVTIEAGESTSVKLYEKYSDGSQKDITNEALYNVADRSVAEISQNGKIRGISGGKTLITADLSGVSSTVKAPRALSVTVTETVVEENTDYEVESTGGGVEITKYKGSDTRVDIPSEINGSKVVAIGDKAFSKTNIVSVTMPQSVTYIGEMAFYNCKSLKTVNFSSRVSEIGSYAFDSCVSLTGVTLPAALDSIPDYAFRSCKSLKRITLNRNISYVGSSAFAFCKTLKVTVINDDIEISSDAFTSGESIAIYANSPSNAEEYAEAHSISFYAQ